MAKVKFKQKEQSQAAPESPRSLTPPPRKRRRGTGDGSGCRIVLLIFVLFVVAVGVLGYQFRQMYTSTAPSAMHVPHIRDAVARKAYQKAEALRTAADINAVLDVTLTETELNALINRGISESGWQGKLVASMEDKLILAYSMPLNACPGFSGRHLVGVSTFELSVVDGQLEINCVNAKLNGRNLPGFIRKRLGGDAVARRMLRGVSLADLVNHVGQLEITGKTMTIVTRHVSETDQEE